MALECFHVLCCAGAMRPLKKEERRRQQQKQKCKRRSEVAIKKKTTTKAKLTQQAGPAKEQRRMHASLPACFPSRLLATPLHAWRPVCLRTCLSVCLPCKALVRLRARRRFTSYNVFMTAPWRPLYCQLYWKFQWPLKRAVRAATLKSLHRIIELGMQDCEPMRVANHGPAMERGRS